MKSVCSTSVFISALETHFNFDRTFVLNSTFIGAATTRETEPGNIIMEALKRSRAGHISAVTRLETSLKSIIDKDPSDVTRFELSKLKFAADKSRNQQAKVASLDEQIKAALVQAKADLTVLSEEDEKIIDNELKLGSIIQGLDDFIEAV